MTSVLPISRRALRALEECMTDEHVWALVEDGRISLFEGARMVRENRTRTCVCDETGMFAPGTVELELEELFENKKEESE